MKQQKINLDLLQQVLGSVSKHSNQLEPGDYRKETLKELCLAYDCDSGIWVNYDVTGTPWGISLYRLDELIVEDFFKIQHSEENKVFFQAILGLGKVVVGEDVIPLEDMVITEAHASFYKKYGIIHGVGFSYEHDETLTYTNIHLNRADPEHPFSRRTKMELDVVLPSIVEMSKSNLELYFLRMTKANPHTGHCLSTRMKDVLFTDELFESLMLLEFDDMETFSISKLDLGSLRKNKQSEIFLGKRIVVTQKSVGDLILLTAIPLNPLAKLTDAERKIASYIFQGKGDEEIAQYRGTSVKTVRNQKTDIFKKVGVSSSKQLVTLMAHMESNLLTK